MKESYLMYKWSNKKGYRKEFINFKELYSIFEVDYTKAGAAIKLREKLKKGMTIQVQNKDLEEKTFIFDGERFVSKENKPLLGYTYDQDYNILSIESQPLLEYSKARDYIETINWMYLLKKFILYYVSTHDLEIKNKALFQNIGDQMLAYEKGLKKDILSNPDIELYHDNSYVLNLRFNKLLFSFRLKKGCIR